MTELIEPGIRPLVDALNALGYASTVYSCEGHFDRSQNELFLPTAYATFSVQDMERFLRLYERLLALAESSEEGVVKLTYDCLLGRYTLSAWPNPSARAARDKRADVNALVQRISEIVDASHGRGRDVGARRAVPVQPEESALLVDGHGCAPPQSHSRNRSTMSGCAESGLEKSDAGTGDAEGAAFPCGHAIAPCALVIPRKVVECPFAGI